jgi:cytochrome c-type biogenesis protein CcmH
MIWFAVFLLVLAAMIVVLPPLLKGATPVAGADSDLAVYRDQLKELDVDQARGLISTAEADAARIEIKRRILALAPSSAPAKAATAKGAKPLAIAVAFVVVAVSVGTYLALGRPYLPARPYDPAIEQEAAGEDMLKQIDSMVGRLAERLKQQPNDAEGWRMLGWSYVQLGRLDEGIEALKRAVALNGENGPLRSLLGEALLRQAGGKVTPEALASFEEAVKRDAKDPRARFYIGLGLMQAGKDRAALEAWVAIIRDGPPDAEWLPAIRAEARELAVKLKLDPTLAVP